MQINLTYDASTGTAKALGLLGASSSNDGDVGFDKNAAWDFDDSNGVSPGTYDLFGVVAHEFSEVMGRSLLVGKTLGPFPNSYDPFDLFHFSGNGVRDFVGTTTGYFSADGGATNLNNFNTNSSGDFGDWAGTAGNDAFLAFSNSGVINGVTNTDLRAMDVIGWDRAA